MTQVDTNEAWALANSITEKKTNPHKLPAEKNELTSEQSLMS